MGKFFIGESLRVLRERRGLRKSELARMTGLGHGFVSELESNKKEPCAGTLIALSRALEVTTDEVLGKTPVHVRLGRHLALLQTAAGSLSIRDLDTGVIVDLAGPTPLYPGAPETDLLQSDPATVLAAAAERLRARGE